MIETEINKVGTEGDDSTDGWSGLESIRSKVFKEGKDDSFGGGGGGGGGGSGGKTEGLTNSAEEGSAEEAGREVGSEVEGRTKVESVDLDVGTGNKEIELWLSPLLRLRLRLLLLLLLWPLTTAELLGVEEEGESEKVSSCSLPGLASKRTVGITAGIPSKEALEEGWEEEIVVVVITITGSVGVGVRTAAACIFSLGKEPGAEEEEGEEERGLEDFGSITGD